MGRKKGKGGNVTLVDTPRVIHVEYQLLVAERDDLLEAEIGYKRRIDQLEKETTDTLKSFDILYNENKILRTKLDTPDGAGAESVESYNAIFKDRTHLREANRAFKRRIRQLEEDTGEAQKSYNQLYQNHQLVTQKAQLETEFSTRSKDEKINEMEQHHEDITKQLQMFLKEREQHEYRVGEMDKERNELQNKYDTLAEEKHEFQLRCDVLQADREKLKQTIIDLEGKVPDREVKAKEEQHFLSMQAKLVTLQVSNTDSSKAMHKLKEEIRVLNKLKKERVEMIDRALSVITDEEEDENERQKHERYAEVEFELGETIKRGIHLLKENDKLKSDTALLESTIANLELKINDLQVALNAKITEVEDLSVLVQGGQSLNDDFLVLQDKVKDLSALRQALENELIQEKKLSKLKIMELNKDLEKTIDSLNELDKQKRKLDGDTNRLHNENNTLLKVTEAQALELRNMKAQIEQIQNMLEDKIAKYDEMKKTEKDNQRELGESRLQHHIVKRELDDLRKEKAGYFSTLKDEMETARDDRYEETVQMRKQTANLKEEVKRLKEYEHKILTMDTEIRRLMNRLRMTDRFRHFPKKSTKGEGEKDEMKMLKKQQRDMEKEKMVLIQEKRQWEILKVKYADLQTNNRRLVEENKRVRGDIDGSSFKVDTLEKRLKKLSIKSVDDANDYGGIQHATYVDKQEPRDLRNSLVANRRETKPKEIKRHSLKPIEEEQVDKITVDRRFRIKTRGIQLTKFKERRKFERKTTRILEGMSGMRSKKPGLPKLDIRSGILSGNGYQEIHKNRYRPTATLELL